MKKLIYIWNKQLLDEVFAGYAELSRSSQKRGTCNDIESCMSVGDARKYALLYNGFPIFIVQYSNYCIRLSHDMKNFLVSIRSIYCTYYSCIYMCIRIYNM